MYYILLFFYFTITAINLIIISIIITNVLFISYIHLPLNVHQESEIFGLNNNFRNSLNSMKQCHTNWHMCLPTVHIVHMVGQECQPCNNPLTLFSQLVCPSSRPQGMVSFTHM